jgi:hypothetical protein
MQPPRAWDAARDAGAAGAGATPSGTPAASGCASVVGGVVRPPAALRVRAVVPHTGAWRPQAACNMHVRVPASARARMRAVRPLARASARHTHVSPTILQAIVRVLRAPPGVHCACSLLMFPCCPRPLSLSHVCSFHP